MRRSAGQRAEILAQFDRSGLSGPQLAGVAGFSYQTLASWIKKRREAAVGPIENAKGSPVFFMQAVVGSSSVGSAAHARMGAVRWTPHGGKIQ